MQFQRINSKLIITDFSEHELAELKQLCYIDYRIQQMGRVKHEYLRPYVVDDGAFSTSMAFLHEIRDKFPDAENNIEPMDKIPIPFKPKFNLWKEQEDLLVKFYKKGRSVIELPTGAGKTLIGIYALKILSYPTIILIPTDIIQKDTWHKMLVNDFEIPREMIGFFGGRINGITTREIKPITISTYKSAYIKIKELMGKFEFAIYDEVHHIGAKTYREIPLKLGNLLSLGLSASPNRQDNNHPFIFKTIGKLIRGPNIEDMASQNKVARMEHEVFFVNLTESEREKYDYYNALAGANTVHEIMSIVRAEDKDNVMLMLQKNIRSVKSSYSHKARELAMGSMNKLPIVHELICKHYNNKILIFSLYLKHLETIKQIVGNMLPCEVISYKTGDYDTRRILADFHSGKIRVLGGLIRPEEGLNIPSADVAIVLAGYGIKRQKIQRSGRIRRYMPLKVAKLYEIVARNTSDEELFRKRSRF